MAKKELMKFRLKEGVAPHYEPNPEFDPNEPETEDNIRSKEYVAGDIVKSSRPLDKLFVNKFIPLTSTGDRSNVQSSGGDVSDDSENDPDKDRPVRDYEDARVNRGDRHATEEELEGKKDLQKLAKGKKIEDTEDEDEEESSESESEKDDVTDQFDGAKEGGLQVFKDSDGKYHVHEEGEDEPMDGSKKGFSKKSDVAKFVKKNVKSEE